MSKHTVKELRDIITLQRQNLEANISSKELEEQGFVTVVHDVDLLGKICGDYQHSILYDGNTLMGYALVMLNSFAHEIPVLVPMFDMINDLDYKGKPLSQSRYFIMGQVCIAKTYRGGGVFKKLYDQLDLQMKDHFDYIITEVAERNVRSIKAHAKVGFETIHIYTAQNEDWHILLKPISVEQ